MSLYQLIPDEAERFADELNRLAQNGSLVTAYLPASQAMSMVAAAQLVYTEFQMPSEWRGDVYAGSQRLIAAFEPHSPFLVRQAKCYWQKALSRFSSRLGAAELRDVQGDLFIPPEMVSPFIEIEGVAAMHTGGEPDELRSAILFERPADYKTGFWRYERLVYQFSDRRIILHAWIDAQFPPHEMLVMFAHIALRLPVPTHGFRPPMSPWD